MRLRLPSPQGVRLAEERALAGRLAGALYLTAGVTALLLPVMPGVDVAVPAILVVAGASGILVGAAEILLVPWERVSSWLPIASSVSGLPLTALAMWASGGSESPTRFYLLFFMVFCSYFYVRREAVVLIAGTVPVLFSPVLYQQGILGDGYGAELMVLLPIYGVLSVLVMSAKSLQLRLREQTATLSLTDPLTGIANRRAFEQALQGGEFARGRADDRLGLVLVDIDDFKRANTLLGHIGGDHVLRLVAEALRHTAREGDLVARVGGDEFGILAAGISAGDAGALADRVLEAVHQARAQRARDAYVVDVSVGWAAFPQPVSSRTRLYERADLALAEAKADGKARVRGWDAGAAEATPAARQETSRTLPVSTS